MAYKSFTCLPALLEAYAVDLSGMISSLKYYPPNKNKEKLPVTKSGAFIYGGSPGDFYEWEFRTMSKYHGTKDDEKFKLGSLVLEGLSGAAYMVADRVSQEYGALHGGHGGS